MKKIGHITVGDHRQERSEIEIEAGQATELDKLAVAAMTGLIASRVTFPNENLADIAELSYEMAEAMVAQKIKRALEKKADAAHAKADAAHAKADAAHAKADAAHAKAEAHAA